MISLVFSDKLILITGILLVTFTFYMTWGSSNSNRHVSLYVGSEKRYIIDLLEEKILSVEGFRGVSRLEISQGRIRFIDSPCSSHFCIRSGWLNHSIGMIACLPNGISLNFSHSNKVYDAINF